ncbi:hypothetical protein ACFWP3_16380 [Streptomyces sp. NPDC058525]|uniref:hypothetical protein n=1 Tax=Streptomyces sp. NPDC058525 TaxID=3346538 RepID=UPI003662A226
MKLLLDWLEHRRRQRPNTANLHLLINNQTATKTSRASNHWISASIRGQVPDAVGRLHGRGGDGGVEVPLG